MYINTGIAFAYLNEFDSAMSYMRRALALDKDDWIIYYDIAGIALMKQDTIMFYEYFENALEKGADVDMVRGDTDLKDMLNEARVVELLAKFANR